MTADSYSVTKETPKEVKMTTVEPNGKPSEVVVVNIDDERHPIFKCMKSEIFDKITCFLAELIGTALLVLLGCGGCVSNLGGYHPTHLNIVLNFGLVIMIVVQIFGCVSGSHINPAVTVAALVYKLISLPMAGVYFVAQMIGGFVGFGILKAVTPADIFRPPNATGPGLCTTMPSPGVHPAQAVAVEFIITLVLILVVCGVWDPRNKKHHDSVPIKFGLTIASLAMVGGPFTGASMNPARSFAPAVWNGDFKHHWVYWVGPMLAGFLGSALYRAVFRREVPDEEVKPRAPEEFPLQRNNAA